MTDILDLVRDETYSGLCRLTGQFLLWCYPEITSFLVEFVENAKIFGFETIEFKRETNMTRNGGDNSIGIIWWINNAIKKWVFYKINYSRSTEKIFDFILSVEYYYHYIFFLKTFFIRDIDYLLISYLMTIVGVLCYKLCVL